MTGLRSAILRKLAAAVLSATALLGLLCGAGSAAAQTQTAVEYYYDVWNFYFMTSFPAEIAALDGGAFGGAWKRTGQTFTVWSSPSNSAAAPTCRFFSIAFAPKSSHFYTPFASECAIVKTESAWQYEAIAFYIQLADANGLCSGGTIPLYRAYNNGMGGAPNHRYTTSLAILNQMLAVGWVFEGNGNTKVFACVPQDVTPPPSTLVIGTVAMGSPLPGATVTLRDSLGTSRATTTASDGTYTLDVSGLTAPFVAVAVGNSAGVEATLVSMVDVITQSTTNYINITPWTTAIAAALSSTGTARDLDPVNDKNTILSTLNVVENYSIVLLAPTLAAAGYGSITVTADYVGSKASPIACYLNGLSHPCGPIRTPFVANHTGYDAIYDHISIGTTPKGGIWMGKRCISSDRSGCFDQPVYSDPGTQTTTNQNICGSDIATGAPIPCNMLTAPTGDNLVIACSAGCVALGGAGINYGLPDTLPPQNPLAVPIRPYCSVQTSNATPAVGSSITLTAVCSNNPTSYSWTNCSSTTNTCTTTSAAAGAITYTVTAVTAAGPTAPSSVTVTWQSSGLILGSYSGSWTATVTNYQPPTTGTVTAPIGFTIGLVNGKPAVLANTLTINLLGILQIYSSDAALTSANTFSAPFTVSSSLGTTSCTLSGTIVVGSSSGTGAGNISCADSYETITGPWTASNP